MNRANLLSLVVVIGGISALVASTAQSQVGPPKAYVGLQPTTPGFSQTGHSNISGTVRAGQFVGGGGGLTGVNADLLDGINSTSFLQSVPNPLSLVGSSIVTISGTTSNSLGESAGVKGSATSFAQYGLWGDAEGPSSTGVYGVGRATSGISEGGKFISLANSGIGLVGWAQSTSGNAYGGIIETDAPNGIGLSVQSAGTHGIFCTTDAMSGNIVGLSATVQSPTGVGVFGGAWALTGLSRGVSGQSDSNAGRGVNGFATSTAGTTYGVFGETASSAGRGVHGLASSTTGINFGVSGISASSAGRGILGLTQSLTGTTYGGYFETASTSGRGVFGIATNTTASGTPFGVLGQADTGTNGYGVYASGDLGASGVKSFRIDHPQDPENKYIVHYSSESPFPQNFYNGNVTTDGNGYAWVELPEYFADINTNFKYVLTVVDNVDANEFVLAKISKKIVGNRFQIRTSAPRTEVSWEVKADRNDARIQHKRPTDIREKTGLERGMYQHPEYFGQPANKGMDYVWPEQAARDQEAARPSAKAPRFKPRRLSDRGR